MISELSSATPLNTDTYEARYDILVQIILFYT